MFERLREGLGGSKDGRCASGTARVHLRATSPRRTCLVAAALEEADVRRGERVLIVLPDVPAFSWVFFGTLARGAVVAMGNPDVPLESLEYLIE